VAHRLDVVAVGVEHERTVVARVVDLAHARRAVVAAARGHRGVVERADVAAALGAERDVDLVGGFADADPEVGLARNAEPGELFHLHDQGVSEGRERLGVERHTRVEVCDQNTDVIEHGRDDTPRAWARMRACVPLWPS
jgi:hypothetical protein